MDRLSHIHTRIHLCSDGTLYLFYNLEVAVAYIKVHKIIQAMDDTRFEGE